MNFLIIGVNWRIVALFSFVIAVLLELIESCCCSHALILRIIKVIFRRHVEIGFCVSGGPTLRLLRCILATLLPSGISGLSWRGYDVASWFTLDHDLLGVNHCVNVVFASTNGPLSILASQSV